MGASLYDEYLREQQPSGDSLYDEYLAEQRKKKPGVIRRVLDRFSKIGSDDDVTDPMTGAPTRRSQTPSSSRLPNDVPGDIDLGAPPRRRAKKEGPSRLEDLAIDMQSVEPGMPPRREPREFGKSVLRGTGQLTSVAGSALETATRGRVGGTARKVGRAMQETAGAPRIKRMGDIRGVGDALSYGGRVVGESAPWMAADVAAGAVAGPLGVYGMQGVIVSGMIREELQAQGVTDENTIDKVTAAIGVPAAAAGGALPAMVLRNILRSAVGQQVARFGIRSAAKTVAKQAITGAAGLAGQQTAIYAGTRAMTGKKIDPAELYDVAASSAEFGGTAGALTGAVTAGARPRAPKLHPETPPAVAQRIADSANQPERIVGAATMVNGNVYRGEIHADAVRAAIAAGDLPAELLNAGEMDATHLDHGAIDGFITSKVGADGKPRFVDRAEADQIAHAAGQVEEAGRSMYDGQLDALDLKAGEVEAPKVGEMRTTDISTDPARFQFKAGKDEKTGAAGALKKVDLYREDLAGIMTVWRDPEDGKVYVVNGHHRLDLAKRSGAPSVLVRFITAPTAEAARAQGAIQNIAESQGTPTDVAKFLRDTRQTLEDLKAQGVPVEGTLAAKGIGLSRLADDLFQKVATGKLDEGVGVGIGNVTADPDMQRTAVTVIQKSGKRLTEREAADVARQVVADGTENVSQETLFGTEQEKIPLYVEKAQLAGAIQRRLENDKRLFNYVTRGARADELARAGNVINREKSAELAQQSAQLGEVFRQLFTRKGAVSDALTEGARRLAHGEKAGSVVDGIYDGIRQEIQAAFTGGKGEDLPRDEGDAGRHEEAGGVEGGVEPDPTQDALFTPWDDLVGKQRQRLYDKLSAARGKEARNAVIKELRALDKVKHQDPAKGISTDEMARRARTGETKEAIDAIAGEEVVPTSKDRTQSDIFAEAPTDVDAVRTFIAKHEDYITGAELRQLLELLPKDDGVEQRMKELGTDQASEPITPESIASIKHVVDFGQIRRFSEKRNRNNPESLANTDLAGLTRVAEDVGVDTKPKLQVDMLKDEEELPEQGAFFSPTPAAQAIRAKVGLPPLPRPQKALIEISRELADAAGVPLRQGRFNAAMRQAAGVFFPHAETTRVVRYDKVPTVAHEVGHFVSKRHLKNPANKGAAARSAMSLTKGMLGELRAMGHNLYGNRKPAAGYGEEGIAEAFKFYVTDPARLQTEAPEFALALEAELRKEPIVHRALLQAREDYAAHQQSSATARIDALISVNESVRNLPTVDEIVRQATDDLQPFKRAVEEIGGTDDPTENAYILARLTRGDAGLADEMNLRGVIDFHTRKRITDGIIPVLQSVPKEKMQEFRRYLVAERALELFERNVDIGVKHDDAIEVKKLYEGEFKPQAEKLWAHSNALLKYRRDSGLLTDAEYKAILERNQRRAPMYVVFDEEKDSAKGGGWGRRWTRNSSGVWTIKGSARRKVDPLEGYIQDTYKTVDQANRHHAIAALYKLALETEGAGKVVEEVARPKELSKVSLERVFRQLVDLGIVDSAKVVMRSDGKFGIENADGSITDIDGQVLEQWDFREYQNATDAKDMVIPVIIDGTRKWLQIQDPKLFEAVQAMGPEQRGDWGWVVGKGLRAGARALRAGATLTPEFLGRNPFRDVFTAAAYTRSTSKVDTVPFVIFGKGMFHLLAKDDVFQRWRLEGGDNAAQLAIDRKTLQNHIDHVTRNFNEIATDLVIHPIDTLRMVSAAMENATRVGEFSVVEKSELKAGKTPRQAEVAGALASRDITIDFGRHGVAAKQANQIIAFLNANVQGTAKLFTEHRTRGRTVALRAFLGLSVPSMLLFAMQHDDVDYKKLPRWRKSLFWNWVQRDAQGNLEHIWSFPKPFELGILYGTLPEAIMEWWLEHDTKGFKEWARAAAAGFTPGAVPTALLPFVEAWANKNAFTGRKLVPAGAEQRLPAYQTRETTGEFARELGERIHFSPAKIENFVREWWGGLGTGYALPIANTVVRTDRRLQGKEPYKRNNPAANDPLTRVPGLKGFMSYPPSGTETQQVEDFYTEWELADGVRQSYKALKTAGRDEDAHAFAVEHRKTLAAVRTSDSPQGAGALREAYNRLEKVRERRIEILRDDKLSDREKKRRVRILDDRMVRIAERGLQAVK